MSNRIELEKSFVLDEENEKSIQEKIKQENFKLVGEEKDKPYRDIAKEFEDNNK